MNHTVTIDDTAIPDGVIHIADQLPSIETLRPNDTVILRFRPVFIYLTGLVLLASWRKALPANVGVTIDDSQASPETQRFLTNTGFREVIETGTDHPSVPSRIGKVPIQAILRGREKEATVGEIVRILDDYAGQVQETGPFRVLLSELCENVLSHSELTTPGYICARVLENNYKCEIAIADSGIGIEQSFRQGTNRSALQRIDNGESAVAIAMEGMSSSKPEPGPGVYRTYFGFGLFITRRLCEENRGRLTLLSGNSAVTVDRYRQVPRRLARPWRGTFVGLVLDLANPLPLDRVYAEAEALVGPAPAATTVSIVSPPPRSVAETAKKELQQAPPPQGEPREHALRLSNYGTQLLTRELGTAIRADLASYLAAGYCAKIHLDGVEDITPSCVDEAFGKLSEVLGADTFAARVVFEGGQPIARTLIQFVLKTRHRSG